MFGAALFGNAMKAQASMQYKGKQFDLTTADGVTLFNTTHPPKVSGEEPVQPVQRRLLRGRPGPDGDGNAPVPRRQRRDPGRGAGHHLIPEVASLKKAVFAAIGADKEPTTSNNAFNYQYGRWTVIIWSYLTGPVHHGEHAALGAAGQQKYNQTYGGAVWNDRVKLAVRSTVDENTDANVWRGRSRFNAAFNDWRFCRRGRVRRTGTAGLSERNN